MRRVPSIARRKTIPGNHRIIFNPTNERMIGIGRQGAVYSARIKFDNNHRIRVAIKQFHFPLTPIQIKRYPLVIARLEKEGVKLPRMQLVQLANGEWVLVMQLFGSNSKKPLNDVPPSNREAIRQAIIEATKIANAGFPMHEEILDNLRYPRRGIIPIDIQTLVEGPQRERTEEGAKELVKYIDFIEHNRSIQKKWIQLVYRHAKPHLRAAIRKIRPLG